MRTAAERSEASRAGGEVVLARYGPAYFRMIRRLRTHDRPRLPQYPGVPVGWRPAREPSGGSVAGGAVNNEKAGERCECSPAPNDRWEVDVSMNQEEGQGKDLGPRFWSKVQKAEDPEGCWLWTGAIARNGYGNYQMNGTYRKPHRLAYEALVGQIPTGLVLDHLCRVRACVNPAHLEPVTNRTNILRGVGTSAAHARKEFCPQGHLYDLLNTYFSKRGRRQKRECRTCHRLKVAATRAHKALGSRATVGIEGEHARMAAWWVVRHPDGGVVVVSRSEARSMPVRWGVLSSHRFRESADAAADLAERQRELLGGVVA